MPYITTAGETKTKPTQHAVKELRSIGIQPNILLCRSEKPIPLSERKKIALFCNIKEDAVIQALDTDTIYQVPINYHEEGLDTQVLKAFGIESANAPDLSAWESVVKTVYNLKDEVTIGMVGKYTSLTDAYKSILESLDHAGIANKVKVNVKWINSRKLDKKDLRGVDGILVPGGFGDGGTAGKIDAITYARENNVPFFGICFGMQMAVIETMRNVAGIKDACSTEFGPAKNPVIGLLTEWEHEGSIQKRDITSNLGGTMRLGSYICDLVKGTKVAKIYSSEEIAERHRHRYEVNINYRDQLKKAGMVFSGMSPDGELPEIVERKDHPWFIGTQFHPEFKSRIFKPHPLFKSFVEASVKHKKARKKK